MDCFDTNYYKLNRKLLILIGQWPYQSHSNKVKIWILCFIVLFPAFISQVLKLLTTEFNFELCMEILCDEVTGLLALIRSLVYTVNIEKVRTLFRNMKAHWESLLNDDENKIFSETIEEGRLYALHYIIFIYTIAISTLLTVLSSPLLSYVHLINDSHARILIYQAEYLINQQKYYYLVITHMILVVLILATWMLASDTFFMIFMYHTIGMFKIVCYRLEHTFDHCNSKVLHPSGRTDVCQRVSTAVECHKSAIRFCDEIVSTFALSNTLSLLLVVINVTAAFYMAAISKEQGVKMAIGMMLGIGQLAHMFSLDIPAQKITDYSKEVIFKAYSSRWYMGQTKEQSLLLYTMLRGLKPSAMMLGKIYPMTLENYATEVKASFSYITVLMSLK